MINKQKNIELVSTLCSYFFDLISTSYHIDLDAINICCINLANIIYEINPLWPHHYIDDDDFDMIIQSLVNINKILNCDVEYLNNENLMIKFKLKDIIYLLKKEHYHQHICTENIFTLVPLDSLPKVTECKYHEESLFDHSIMAMIISLYSAVYHKKNYLEVGLTALFHDCGKVSTIAYMGSTIGYPFHGEFGAGILSQIGSDELFKLIPKDRFELIVRTISIHMCSYNVTEHTEWTNYRMTMAQLENHDILIPLSYGDTFGKISEFNETNKFIVTRNDYNNIISQKFNTKLFMEKHNFKTLIFFVRGFSNYGKTTYINDKLKPFLNQYFNSDQILIINHNTNNTNNTNNTDIMNKIFNGIEENKIIILESDILYYDVIKDIMPPNINLAFIIAIDCIRNMPSDSDRHRDRDRDIHMIKDNNRSLINWFNRIDNKEIKLNILASITTKKAKPNETYIPHLVFVNGFNYKYEIGFETFKTVTEPIISYFKKI